MKETSKVNEAIRAVLADIHRLKKDDKNQHGGYAYVSVDDVKDHVRPLLAKNSLHFSITEVSYELVGVAGKSGTTSSAKIAYEVRLRHVSGEEMPPEFITIVLPYTGAQTAGAARSYAVKEWMKSTLLVSTGEKDAIVGGADADAYAQQDYTAPARAPITAEQFRTLQDLIEKTGTDESKLLGYVKADSLETLTMAQFQAAEAALKKKMNTPKAEAA
jgi:hypothetical protein